MTSGRENTTGKERVRVVDEGDLILETTVDRIEIQWLVENTLA